MCAATVAVIPWHANDHGVGGDGHREAELIITRTTSPSLKYLLPSCLPVTSPTEKKTVLHI
jgi:hypothetical protein